MTNQKLDEIADRLTALYRRADEEVLGPVLATVSLPFLAEIRSIKDDLELATGRIKRQRNIRKAERRRLREMSETMNV